MGLRSKVENGIDVVHLESIHDLIRLGDVSMDEGEVRQAIKNPSIV